MCLTNQSHGQLRKLKQMQKLELQLRPPESVSTAPGASHMVCEAAPQGKQLPRAPSSRLTHCRYPDVCQGNERRGQGDAAVIRNHENCQCSAKTGARYFMKGLGTGIWAQWLRCPLACIQLVQSCLLCFQTQVPENAHPRGRRAGSGT